MTSFSSKTLSGRNKQRVMVFGTFDGLHPGHENFFQQARDLAKSDRAVLIVSVARDKNVLRIKGRLPHYNEQQRLKAIKKHALVDKAVLGAIGNHLPHIIKEKPDVIALGYDQKEYVAGLKTFLQKKGLNPQIVRLKSHYPGKFKSSLLKK